MTNSSFLETSSLFYRLLAHERKEAVAMVTALALPGRDWGRAFYFVCFPEIRYRKYLTLDRINAVPIPIYKIARYNFGIAE